MNFFRILALTLCGAGWLTACRPEPQKAGSLPTQEVVIAPAMPTNAQPKLDTIKLYIGPEVMETEAALTWEQSRAGLMFRTNMAENAGMIFLMPGPMQASFWMKNCPLPLSIAYIDSDGVIVEIHDMQPHDTNSVKSASSNIFYALEANQGWFQRHNIEPGTLIRTPAGSLAETFARSQPTAPK